MEEIYMNVEYDKSVHSRASTNQTDQKSLRGAATDLSTIKANLKELLQDSLNKLSSLTEVRNLLNASLIETTEERDRLLKMITQRKTCPAGWTMFRCSCYFLSSVSGSWSKGRQDCNKRGGDLVVIDSAEEQTFLSEFTKVESWIGLTDGDKEGTWNWVDGTPLTVKYWSAGQPDNGNRNPMFGEEDCVHFRQEGTANWNDRSCGASLRWICEKSLLKHDIQKI
uniref:C-type lectin domain-containing protein n=1 Tax=Anabas testudineus TaxID=64144 RepID=A0AAQ6ILM6_ANATE